MAFIFCAAEPKLLCIKETLHKQNSDVLMKKTNKSSKSTILQWKFATAWSELLPLRKKKAKQASVYEELNTTSWKAEACNICRNKIPTNVCPILMNY